METEQMKIREDLQKWIEAMNTRDLERIDRLADVMYATDWVLHDPGVPNVGRGPAGIKQLARQILHDLPDAKMSIADMFGEGDRLAVRVVCRSTDATTGKLVSFPLLWISRFVGNQVVEDWELVGPAAEVPA